MVPKIFKGLATQGRDGDVHPLVPTRLALADVPAMHDAVGDADLRQGLPSAHGLIRLVRQHRRLITTDEGIGSDALRCRRW